VHVVDARKFVLIAADHPVVSALSENAERLQVQPPPDARAH